MKLGWDARAREDAKWFINTLRPDQTEEEFDETGSFEVRRQIIDSLWLLAGGRDPKTLRLLEIGCGIGRMTRHLADIFGEVHATDVSAEMIRQARERLRHLSNVFLHETSGCDFAGLPDEHFDLIFSAYVFQHVPGVEVIRSNLRDGWRVLKPGGVFKFVTNGMTDEDFGRMPKDTWTGAAFPEAAIRRAAGELGAQLLGITGEDTQYCWTVWRKRRREGGAGSLKPSLQPRILLCGWADDPGTPEIPVRGDRAYLTLLISGHDPDAVDAASLTVELGGQQILPRYCGPMDVSHLKLLPAEIEMMNVVQVNAKVPGEAARGATTVRVRVADAVSNAVTASLVEPDEKQNHVRPSLHS